MVQLHGRASMSRDTSRGASVRISDYGGPSEHLDLWLRFKAGETLTPEELATLFECGAI